MKDKLFIGALLSIFFFSCTEDDPKSRLPEKEAQAVKKILEANGYSINDDLTVDDYVHWNHSGDGLQKNYTSYELPIPKQGYKELVLTDAFNDLIDSEKFLKVKVSPTKEISSISIKTDSVIWIRSLEIYDNNLTSLPEDINKIKTWHLDVEDNNISSIPEDIIEMSNVSDVFPSFTISISGNKIDTSKIHQTIHDWLNQYSYKKSEWWKYQDVER